MYRIGIDIGGTSITIGIIFKNKIIESQTLKNSFKNKENELIDVLVDKINYFKNTYKIEFIGIGCPGRVDNSIVYNAANLGIEKLELGKVVYERTNIKTIVNNDATAALYGEITEGSLKGYNNGILLTLGTGVGGGIFIKGKPYIGSNSNAGEFGHVIFQRNGLQCNCGRRGCFEMYGSTTALISLIKNHKELKKSKIYTLCNENIEEINGKIFFEAVNLKDTIALDILEIFTNNIAEGIVDYLTILDCDVVSIGGGISEVGELLLSPIREKVIKYGYNVDVVPATLGNMAGVIGAANLEYM